MANLSNSWKANALRKTVDVLNKANSYLKQANGSIDNLKNIMAECFVINDNIGFKSYIDNSLNEIKSSSSNIKNNIIPSLNKTIDALENN